MKTGFLKYNAGSVTEYRLDPSLFLSEGMNVRKKLEKCPYELSNLSDITSDIFIGNIFSRNWVADSKHGITYLAASDTVLADLEVGRFVSNKQANDLSYLKVEKGWILVTCSGTLGNTVYVNKHYVDKLLTHDLLRIVPNDEKFKGGALYAFLSGKFGYYQITQSRFGGVVKHINSDLAGNIRVPLFPVALQVSVDELIRECSALREKATDLLKHAQTLLKECVGLNDLTIDDYKYFGQHSSSRKVSCFTRRIDEIGIDTINAFNHSQRVRERILNVLFSKKHILLRDALDENGMFSSGGVEVKELKEGHGIMLINQSDIFNTVVKGKWVVNKNRYKNDLLEEGEIIIAKIGTLGENESFCRCVYVGKELGGQLVSSAFYRMKASKLVTPGYLYTWLSSDYGFRLLRHTQYGTKLCYPNPELLYKYPIPIIEMEKMNEINDLVVEVHNLRYEAIEKEKEAISILEEEIEKWNN